MRERRITRRLSEDKRWRGGGPGRRGAGDGDGGGAGGCLFREPTPHGGGEHGVALAATRLPPPSPVGVVWTPDDAAVHRRGSGVDVVVAIHQRGSGVDVAHMRWRFTSDIW